MDPEWWLVDSRTQETVAKRIDEAAAAVIAHFDQHGNENSLTAAFGQELLTTRIHLPGTSVTFSYRNFLEQDEEPLTGADGGIVVTIRTPFETVKKAVLFQAKRFGQDRPVRSLTMRRDDARRLRTQLNRMVPISEEAVVLAHTRAGIYSISALTSDGLTLNELGNLPGNSRLITIGTFLGKWVMRCSRGDLGKFVISQVEEPKGFLNHRIGMDVETHQVPMLSEGGVAFSPAEWTRAPLPRWRR